MVDFPKINKKARWPRSTIGFPKMLWVPGENFPPGIWRVGAPSCILRCICKSTEQTGTWGSEAARGGWLSDDRQGPD